MLKFTNSLKLIIVVIPYNRTSEFNQHTSVTKINGPPISIFKNDYFYHRFQSQETLNHHNNKTTRSKNGIPAYNGTG